MKWIIVIVALIVPTTFLGQIKPDSLFSRDILVKDLEDLKKTILESHPDPYAFCGENEFEKSFAYTIHAIRDSMPLSSYIRKVAQFLNVMQDSHTSLDYGYLQDIQFNQEGYYLPLSVRKAEGEEDGERKIVVAGEWTHGIPKGSELISINNHSSEDVFKLALQYACIEGQSKIAQTSIAVALVPIVCGLEYGYQKNNTVCYIPPGTDEMKVTEIPGYHRKEFNIERREREKQKPSWMPELTMDDDNDMAILKIPTFSPLSGKKYAKAIRQSFLTVNQNNINNLVIDLRGNGGGSSAWVEYLYSFLDDNGYNTPDNVIGRNSELAKNRNRIFHTGIAQLIIKIFYRKDEDVISYQRISKLPFGAQDTVYFQKPTKQKDAYIYRGKSYLLINGLTASAGVDFTHAFKSKNRGEIVGEQCLGPETGTWGNPSLYTMPETGVRMTISTIRYNYDRSFRYESKAIEPDHPVGTQPSDLFQDRDTQIEYVKKIIREKQ